MSSSLIITPTTSTPRSILPTLRLLSSWTCSPTLLPLTLIHTTLPTLISTTTPLVLRSNLGIDPIITPSAYAVATFLTSTAELFLRLPFETVLRRGQMREVQLQQDVRVAQEARGRRNRAMYDDDEDDDDDDDDDTLASAKQIKSIVPLGAYYGILPTMWRIAREEGSSTSYVAAGRSPGSAVAQRPAMRRVERKGQGMQGLWRGWRVGWWGLVGVWSAAALGGGRGGQF